MIYFVNPEAFWLFLIIPLMLFLRGKTGLSAGLKFPSLEVIKKVSSSSRSKAGAFLFILRVLSIACLIFAIAKPRYAKGSVDIEASGIDIMLAIDISGSMEALDFRLKGESISRVEVVKSVVQQFIQERPNDRIGLIAFAGRAYVASPLTLDHNWLLERLNWIKTGTMQDGTAIGSAIAAAVNRLKKQEAKSKIIILLTDGMNNAGKVSPRMAAEVAQVLGIKIYTIAAGVRGEAPMPVKDQFGNRRIVMARVDVDEESLKEVSSITLGQFFRATDTNSLQRIYQEINRLETTTHKMKKFEQFQELFPYFALVSIGVLLLEIILSQTVFLKLP